MEINQAEVKVIEEAVNAMEQLCELELAMVGGGIGNVLLG